MPVAIADKPNPTNLFLDTSLIKDGTTQLDIKNIHPTIIAIFIMFVLVVRTGFEPVSTHHLTECLCHQFSH